MHTRLVWLTAFVAFISCDRASGNPEPERTEIGSLRVETTCEVVESETSRRCVLWGPSLIELIARPELYDGKRVRVIGFVNFEFEGNGLYLSREDWEQSIYRNGIWLDPPAGFESDSGPSTRRPNQQHVIVEGTFHAGRGGHFGMWSGSLDSVTRVDPWGRSAAPRTVLSRPLP